MQLVKFSTTILFLALLLSTNAFPVFLSDSLSEVELHQSGPDTVSLVTRFNKPVVNKPLPKSSTPSTAPKSNLLDKIKNIFSRDTDAVLEVRFNKPVVNKPLPKPSTPSTAPKTGLLDKIKNIFTRDIDNILVARFRQPLVRKPLPAPTPSTPSAAPKTSLLDKIKNIFI
ncbi:hypothetical protein HYALB_00008545 [Hymenoscyphus albidus]|uniref:Uncharacterized protein n=1 Tax=Hymenoscyphus albidus TaxID=595503 RepID=A0A9N9LNR1_9HELO|nr:hypothetical protein HYALB_00008545 [Hymenoscyphus albidus]